MHKYVVRIYCSTIVSELQHYFKDLSQFFHISFLYAPDSGLYMIIPKTVRRNGLRAEKFRFNIGSGGRAQNKT